MKRKKTKQVLAEKVNIRALRALGKICGKDTKRYALNRIKLTGKYALATDGFTAARLNVATEDLAECLIDPASLRPSLEINGKELTAKPLLREAVERFPDIDEILKVKSEGRVKVLVDVAYLLRAVKLAQSVGATSAWLSVAKNEQILITPCEYAGVMEKERDDMIMVLSMLS